MNFLDQTVWLNIAHQVGWTLIHSLWQLAFVVVVVMFALRLMQRAKPQTRYVVAGSGLLLMACLPIISFVFFATGPDDVTLDRDLIEHDGAVADRKVFSSDNSNEFHNDPVVSETPVEQHIAGNSANFVTDSSSSNFESAEVLPTKEKTVTVSLHSAGNRIGWLAYYVALMPWVTSVWLAGVCVFAAMHARGLLVVHRMSQVGTIESERHLLQRMESLSDRLGVHITVRLLETARVNTPLVIGWFRPVILVPLGMVAGLPAVQLDAVLLHELAHIRRHDYFVNALQVIIETLLFYHPAVWWLSRRIRTEREYCCDDIAAAGCGSNLDLAKALAALETSRVDTPLALAASGTGKEKATMKRVRRLLERPSNAAASGGALEAVLASLLFGGIAACFAMTGEDNQSMNSQPANQHNNRNQRKSTRDSVAKIHNDLREDLVVYYSFDDDTNGKVYDESGNENHGATVGDVKYESSFLGRAAGFTSNRTYIQSGKPGLNMHGWKQVSVSMWIKTKRYTTYGRLISRGEVSGDGLSGIAMQAGSGSSKASFSIGRQFQNGPAIWEKLYTSSLEPNAMDRINQWVHLVGVFDGERLRFYVNGKLDREVEASGHNLQLWDSPTHKLVIGNSSLKSRMAWGDKYFNGLVDEVKIWRRSLSTEEIKHVYHQGERSISSRRIGELSQNAVRLAPATGFGVGQQTTGLDLSDVLRNSDQQRDIDAFTDDHRFFQRDVEHLVKSQKTWALCGLLDHKSVDAKILAARGLLKLADPQSVPILLAAAKRNNYVVKGSEGAALHSIYRRTLKEAMEKITEMKLTPSERPKGTEEIGFAKVEDWIAEFILDTASTTSDRNKVPKPVDLGKDAIRFEGHDLDKVEPGLVAVGAYPVKTLPTAKAVLERHRSGEVPAGHAELVGRLPLTLADFGMKGGSQLVVESFERKGTQITANVKYIRKFPKDRVENAVYLRAKLPNNLPPGKYHVAIDFTSYYVGAKGEHVVAVFDWPIPAMTCEFEVPNADSAEAKPVNDDKEANTAKPLVTFAAAAPRPFGDPFTAEMRQVFHWIRTEIHGGLGQDKIDVAMDSLFSEFSKHNPVVFVPLVLPDLIRLAPRDRRTVDVLNRALEEGWGDSSFVRAWLVRAGETPEKHIPVLMKTLDDPSYQKRISAFRALSVCGIHARVALPRLRKIVDEADAPKADYRRSFGSLEKTPEHVHAQNAIGLIEKDVNQVDEVTIPPKVEEENGRKPGPVADPSFGIPGGRGQPARVNVNSQKTLADAVGEGFLDRSWTYPKRLVPTEFPKLEYVSGPTDKSLSPKSVWRKPIVLNHEDSGVVLHVNCYRRRDKPDVKVVKSVGTPFAPHKEPDYQYKPLKFHDLRAAAAATERRDVIAFRRGDILYKIEAIGGDAEARKEVAAKTAETIRNSQQAQ